MSLGIVGWTLGPDTGLRTEDFDLAKILDLSLQRGSPLNSILFIEAMYENEIVR